MRFSPPSRPKRADSAVPMINVVFLLLIFFMLSAQIAPAPPFELSLPEADPMDEPVKDAVLYVSSDGALAFQDARGEAVWAALAALAGDQKLTIRADGALPGAEMARILAQLGRLGVEQIELAVARP